MKYLYEAQRMDNGKYILKCNCGKIYEFAESKIAGYSEKFY